LTSYRADALTLKASTQFSVLRTQPKALRPRADNWELTILQADVLISGN